MRTHQIWLALLLAVVACAVLGAPTAASASTLVDSTVATTLGSLPSTPACSADTGGDVDEEICLFVTNAMTAWHATATGPRLSGTGSKLYYETSSDIASGWKDNYGAYWAGPFCAAATWTDWNLHGGNQTDQAGPTNGRDRCIGIDHGFTFGQRRQVQFWDNDETANSGQWRLKAHVGSVTLGQGIFRVANNDGHSWDGDPYCDDQNNALSRWTSCGPIGTTAYNVKANTAAANDGISASRISAGFYVQDYPVAIKITNALPGSTFVANDPPSAPDNAMEDAAASTFEGGAAAATGHTLWWVGYRQRLGHRNGYPDVTHAKIHLTGTLEDSTGSTIREQWHGATVSITANLTIAKDANGTATGGVDATGSTCKIGDTTASGAQAQCEVLLATHGSPSHPAEFTVRIHN